MRYVEVIECKVAGGAMQRFVNAVQQWERAAMEHPAAPIHHAVLVDDDEPSRVAIITQFADRETAERFRSDGLMDRFLDGVLSCLEAPAAARRYDLFYATGDGPRAIFGETPTTEG